MNRVALAAALIASILACADCLGKPGFPQRGGGVSAQERQALIAVYEATDGNHWKNHDGWLGPVGSECNWFGVWCDNYSDKFTTVKGLDLPDNNLNGLIPKAVGQLTHLHDLFVFGNHLAGKFPDVTIERWLSGSLWINAEAPLLTDVSEIDYEQNASMLLCGRSRIVLRSDGSAMQLTERCRNATPTDRKTFCEVKTSDSESGDFAMLAWLLEKNGFFMMKPEYNDRNITEGTFESARVMRGSKKYEVVTYAGAGPLELWTIHRGIEGVASLGEWKPGKSLTECPRWDKTPAPRPN